MVAHQTDALAHNRCWLDRTALEGQISAAQTALQAAIDQVQQNLDDAKAELDKAIADGDKALDDKIKALSDALAAAKTALDTTGETNKTVLEGQISAAQTTLQAAIDTLNERLVTAEDELTAVRSETKKSARYGDHRDLRSVCHSRCCDFDCCHDPDTKKQEMTSRKMLKHGDGKKFFRNFLPSFCKKSCLQRLSAVSANFLQVQVRIRRLRWHLFRYLLRAREIRTQSRLAKGSDFYIFVSERK